MAALFPDSIGAHVTESAKRRVGKDETNCFLNLTQSLPIIFESTSIPMLSLSRELGWRQVSKDSEVGQLRRYFTVSGAVPSIP